MSLCPRIQIFQGSVTAKEKLSKVLTFTENLRSTTILVCFQTASDTADWVIYKEQKFIANHYGGWKSKVRDLLT